jgi:hypothetical protein
MHGEDVCGDAWFAQYRAEGLSAIVADGLGHGMYACDAATAAVTAFQSGTFGGPTDALEAIHSAIQHTRGAAATIVDVEAGRRSIRVAGVGNVAAAVALNGHVRQAVSQNGTLGHQARYFKEYTYPWEAGSLLIMHSDGLTAHWSFDKYPGLQARHPALIAGVLYRDFGRRRDDMTVLVAREIA